MKVKHVFINLALLQLTFLNIYSKEEREKEDTGNKSEISQKQTQIYEDQDVINNSKNLNNIESKIQKKPENNIELGIKILSENNIMKKENNKILKLFQDYFINIYSIKTNWEKMDNLESKFVNNEMENDGILDLRKRNETDEYIPGINK